ncbi:uncharacterized protein LOC104681408 [Rhinopithecus roxellana]|uniref:uncharacterized protein LOC104681408 n=1 Tax=Rhinopithecus roxellana TaxID=61622 RepID=UPI0012375412|nr:uncharacterized protein LOC104681408 [Rhinopithecus roxellana]
MKGDGMAEGTLTWRKDNELTPLCPMLGTVLVHPTGHAQQTEEQLWDEKMKSKMQQGSDVTVGTALWGQGRPSSSAPAHSDTDLVTPLSWPDPAMGTRLLCWVVLGFLGTDHTGAGVSQSPRYRVTKRRQEVALRCDPISGHEYLYWYQQAPGQGPEFLIYFRDDAQLDKSGLLSSRFSAERPKGSVSTLKIQHTEQGDAAVYLCASSLATEWHGRLLPVHKPHPSLSLLLLETLSRGLSFILIFHGKGVDLDIGCPLESPRLILASSPQTPTGFFCQVQDTGMALSVS